MGGSLTFKLGAILAGGLLAGTVLAQAPGGGPGMGFGDHRPPMERSFGAEGDHGRWWNNPRMIERLKLTDDQRKAMDATLLEHREKLIDLRGSLEKAELELEPMMKQDQPNEGQILAQIDKIAQARAELEKANARFLLAIRSKLTPEQWKMMEADRAGRERGAWGGRQGDGEGPGNWRRDGQRHGNMPPPATGAPSDAPDGATPPPASPQSMVDAPPPPDPGGDQQ